MKTKLKEDKGRLSSPSFPTAAFPSVYFVNKLNPAPEYKLLDVMWIFCEVFLRLGINNINTKLRHPNQVCATLKPRQ